ncbi:glycosyltransferase family 8 protein [Sphaerobolus stellatus SS14]|uniref:Glycosyltransferase family 8 protein n=1 Tax=Sphaerobolus stellatus (strain SS14) TaxID=990650 RepID=A0A0C9T5E7_SPHS4|nr:glycosyltransferase family 8 protein [Sphaerobolus stellatus SS14]
MYLPDRVSRKDQCLAQAAGWDLFPVKLIPPLIASLVYLDADIIVRNNFDELFTLPYTFTAAPDIWLDKRGFTVGVNAGVLLVRPNTMIFHDMLAKMETAKYPLAFAEQAFLNAYFGFQAMRLPLAYNGNMAIKWKSRILLDSLQRDLRVIHYTLVKPFSGVAGSP